MDSATHPSLRVIVEKHDGQFLAQCVDFDLAAAGDDVDDAIQAFIRLYMKNVLVAHELGVEPFAQTPPAPAEYAEAWKRSALHLNQIKPVRIPAFAVVKQGQSTPSHLFGQVEAAIPAEVAA